jgi:predicted nucleotidyltransferase component of viral defense system
MAGHSERLLQTKTNSMRQKEELARDALFRAAKDRHLSKLVVLQGGNALHFIYSSPRHSFDLDFTLSGPKVGMTEAVSLFCNALSDRYEVSKTSSKNHEMGARALDRIKYWAPETEIRGIVEICAQIALNPVEAKGMFAPLLVETPQEIYADKIVATMGRMKARGSIKGTDLYDLLYISETLKITASENEILEKARTYSFLGWERDTLHKVINHIRSPENFEKMRSDIDARLVPDIAAISKFGGDFFEKSADFFNAVKSAVMQGTLYFPGS